MMERFGDRRYAHGAPISSGSVSGTIRANGTESHNTSSNKSLEISVPASSRSATLALAKLSNHSHNLLNKSVVNNNNSNSISGAKGRLISPNNSHNEQPPPPNLPPIPSSIFKHKHLQYIPQDKQHQPPQKPINNETPPLARPPGNTGTGTAPAPTMANGRVTNLHHSSSNGPVTNGTTHPTHHPHRTTHNSSSLNVHPSMKSVGVGTNLNYTRSSMQQQQQLSNHNGTTGPLPILNPQQQQNHNPEYRNYHHSTNGGNNNSLHHPHPHAGMRYPGIEGQIQPISLSTSHSHSQPLHSPSHNFTNSNGSLSSEVSTPRNKSEGPLSSIPSPQHHNPLHSPTDHNLRNPDHQHQHLHSISKQSSNNSRFPSHISPAQSEILNNNMKSSANKIVSQNLNGTLSVTGIPSNDSELQLFRVLQRANLLNYFDVMIELGGDDVNQLCDAGEEEFLEIMALIGMASKPLHVRRLQKSLQDWVTQPSLFPNAILGPPLSAFANGSGQPFPTLQNGSQGSNPVPNNVQQIAPIRPIPYHSGSNGNPNFSGPVPHGPHESHPVHNKYSSIRNANDLGGGGQHHSSSGSEKSNSPNPPVLHLAHHHQLNRPNSASPSSISSNPAHSPPTHSQQINLSNRTQSSFQPVVPSSSPSITKTSSGYYSHQTLPNGLSLRIPADSLPVESRFRGHNDSNSNDSHSSNNSNLHETRTVTSPIPFLQDYEIKKITESAMRVVDNLPEFMGEPRLSGRRKSSADFESVARLSEDDPKRYEEIRKCAAIYGRYDSKRKVQKPLTIHELSLNEAAFHLCKNIPALLTRREELLILSRQAIKEAGLPYSSLMTVPPMYSLNSRSNREKNSDNNTNTSSRSTNNNNNNSNDIRDEKHQQQVSNNSRGSEPQDYRRPNSVPNGNHSEPSDSSRPGSGPPNLNETSRSNSPSDVLSHSRKRSAVDRDQDPSPPPPPKKYNANGNGKQDLDSEPSDLSVITNNSNNNNTSKSSS